MTVPTRDPELESFLAVSRARLAPRTVESYRRDLEDFGRWRGAPIGGASSEEIESYLAGLRAAGRACSTPARRLAALRSFFRHQALIGARDLPALSWSIAITRKSLASSTVGSNGLRCQNSMAERIPPGAISNSGTPEPYSS